VFEGGAYWDAQIAKWDGSTWSRILAPYGDAPVLCMQAFDDGSGRALYASAGGNHLGFGPYFGRWDGHHWSHVGKREVGNVQAMTVFDDGSGPALYVGGSFIDDGQFGDGKGWGLLRWDGRTWSHVGPPNGIFDAVYALGTFDDGTGPALYAGGEFGVGGRTLFAPGNLAKLSHGEWLPVGEGLNSAVRAMTVFDDGTGKDLYVGGWFTTAGRYDSRHIARLRGCR
jgi:hypothetical protein